MTIDSAWRHTLGHQDLAYHGRPALDHGVAVHGERRNPTFAVASRTLLGQHWRNVSNVRRHRRLFVNDLRTSDRNFWGAHVVTSQNLSQGCFSPLDATAVLHGEAVRVEDQHLTSMGYPHRLGDNAMVIH